MEPGSVPSHLWALILGWGLRAFFEKPIVPEEKPCICRCSCSCVSEGSGFPYVILAVILLFAVGLAVSWIFFRKEATGPVSPKGRKGVFGVSGKVLSLTG